MMTFKSKIHPNPKLSIQDRGTLYELRQKMEEGGFGYSPYDIFRLERLILRLRATGEGGTCEPANKHRLFNVGLVDGKLEIIARYVGPERTPKERERLEIIAARALFRGKVSAGEERPKGRLPTPLPNWEPKMEIRVVEQDWEVRDEFSRPKGTIEIASGPFKPDIDWIAKAPLWGYWSILQRKGVKSGKLFFGGREVPAKASNPAFRAALVPHIQRGQATFRVAWGPSEDDVETLHLTMSGDTLRVLWDGAASGA